MLCSKEMTFGKERLIGRETLGPCEETGKDGTIQLLSLCVDRQGFKHTQSDAGGQMAVSCCRHISPTYTTFHLH